MTGNLIATTPKASMHALAFQGIMVYASFPQIRDMLMRNFGDEYVLLFARPEENTGDGNIDWYTPVQGNARKLEELPDEERTKLTGRLAEMAREILKLAEQLINTHEPLKVTRGNILKLALQYPDDSCLYAVGGQPVYTCWGFGPGTPGVEGKNLTRLAMVASAVPRREERPVEPVPPEDDAYREPLPVYVARRSGGWGWLWLPLLLLLLLLALLFVGFGPLPAISGFTLFRLPELAFLTGGGDPKADALKDDVADLERRLNDLVAQCRPEEKERGRKPERPKQELVIPEKAEDSSFLAGSWTCDTGLYNSETSEPVKVEFIFDDNGVGKAITREPNDVCQGAAKATLAGGVLRINVEKQVCAKKNSSYNPLVIECRIDANKQTHCDGMNEGGSNWDAIFQKQN